MHRFIYLPFIAVIAIGTGIHIGNNAHSADFGVLTGLLAGILAALMFILVEMPERS